MRKRNYTVTIRMNKAEYDLLQNKVKESGQTQQAVVIHAIAGLKIASAEDRILFFRRSCRKGMIFHFIMAGIAGVIFSALCAE